MSSPAAKKLKFMRNPAMTTCLIIFEKFGLLISSIICKATQTNVNIIAIPLMSRIAFHTVYIAGIPSTNCLIFMVRTRETSIVAAQNAKKTEANCFANSPIVFMKEAKTVLSINSIGPACAK
jgi:hypothetical protein